MALITVGISAVGVVGAGKAFQGAGASTNSVDTYTATAALTPASVAIDREPMVSPTANPRLQASSTPSPLPRADRPAPTALLGDYLVHDIATAWPNRDASSATIDDLAGIDYATLASHVNETLDASTDNTGYVVAVVGTHDLNDSPDTFRADMETLAEQHPKTCVIWVTTHHMDYGFSGVPINNLVRDASYPGFRLVEWDTMVRTNSSLVNADGIHPTPEAARQLADAIEQAGQTCTS